MPDPIRLTLVIDRPRPSREEEDGCREALDRLQAIVARGDEEALRKFVDEEPDWFWDVAGLEKG